MSTTRILDVIEPSVFTNYMSESTPEKYILLQNSGILAPPPQEVSSQFLAGGMTIDMPFWDDLTRGEPDIPSDDPDETLTTDKIGTHQDKAIKHNLVKGWSNMDVSGIVATGKRDDPIMEIADKVQNWWYYALEQKVIKTLTGVFADNSANDSGDMIYSVYSDIASPTAANKISTAAVNSARTTMGDQLEELTTICMHTYVYRTLLNDEKIDFIQPSNAPFRLPTYMGMMVMFSDQMPVVSGTNSDEYTSFLIGRGAFAFMEYLDPSPTKWGTYAVEVVRDAKAGNGGGQDELITRRRYLLHPRGIKWTQSSQASSLAPSNSELILPANWDRVHQRKNIRFAALKTNI